MQKYDSYQKKKKRPCHPYKSKFSNPLVGAYSEVPSQYRSFEVYMVIFYKDISLESKEKKSMQNKTIFIFYKEKN